MIVTVFFAVASYADAWIEIIKSRGPNNEAHVASYADVWIEIHHKVWQSKFGKSHPMRMCGFN